MFDIISKKIDFNGKICEGLDKYFEYESKQRKIIENEHDSQFKDYRDINQKDKEKYVNKKLSNLSIHEKLQKLNLIKVLMDIDATSLYPSSMWDEKSTYPKTETGLAFKPHMNDVYKEVFNNQTFSQVGNENAILKTKY